MKKNLKSELARRIRGAESRMFKAGISASSPYAYTLSHARSEWAQGNYLQAERDILELERS